MSLKVLRVMTAPVVLVLAACSSAEPPNIAAQQGSSPPDGTAVRTMPVVPGRPARVFVFAGWDAACASTPAPVVTVATAPSQGEISFRPGQSTSIAASAGGTCAGQTVTGTGVYYTARAGASGTDRFAVEAKLASGETTQRVFDVTIAN